MSQVLLLDTTGYKPGDLVEECGRQYVVREVLETSMCSPIYGRYKVRRSLLQWWRDEWGE
jgi:hypothetical protein